MPDGSPDFEIRTLAEGQKITEPGFYAIPLSVHHNQPCDGVSVTSSTLRDMYLHGPEYVWGYSALNPARYERPTTAALRTGAGIAAMIEGGPEQVEKLFRVLPADKPNRPTAKQLIAYAEGRATEAALKSIAFWRQVEEDPREILTEAEWDLITQMGRKVATDPLAAACFDGIPELTMAFYDEENDLWCLSRPDITSLSGMLSDFKKISTQGRPMTWQMCDRRITQYRYDMQMGFANEAFERLTGQWCEMSGVVFQMDTPPFSIIARGISDKDLRIGAYECQEQRRRFRQCLDSGEWPGPGTDIGTYVRPEWDRERYEEVMGA